jgi:hypothetical protein
MATPIEELPELDAHRTTGDRPGSPTKLPGAKEEEQTALGGKEGQTTRNDSTRQPKKTEHLAIQTEGAIADETLQSPSRAREEASRLGDDLAMLQVERQVTASEGTRKSDVSRSRSQFHRRSREADDLELETSPSREKASIYRPPDEPNTGVARAFKKIRDSFWLVRYFLYITPITLLLLIPLLLGIFLFKDATVGGVQLLWFSIWLEIVWLSLWAGRVGSLPT